MDVPGAFCDGLAPSLDIRSVRLDVRSEHVVWRAAPGYVSRTIWIHYMLFTHVRRIVNPEPGK
jgi:hypothetical protein